MDQWRDVGRHGDVLDALKFHGMTDDAVDLASKLVAQAKNEVGEDQLFRYEYFPSAEERERAYGLRPFEELGDATRKQASPPSPGPAHYGFSTFTSMSESSSQCG